MRPTVDETANSQYVIVVISRVTSSLQVFGPYETDAAASGVAITLFGPKLFGNPANWHVVRIVPIGGAL